MFRAQGSPFLGSTCPTGSYKVPFEGDISDIEGFPNLGGLCNANMIGNVHVQIYVYIYTYIFPNLRVPFRGRYIICPIVSWSLYKGLRI